MSSSSNRDIRGTATAQNTLSRMGSRTDLTSRLMQPTAASASRSNRNDTSFDVFRPDSLQRQHAGTPTDEASMQPSPKRRVGGDGTAARNPLPKEIQESSYQSGHITQWYEHAGTIFEFDGGMSAPYDVARATGHVQSIPVDTSIVATKDAFIKDLKGWCTANHNANPYTQMNKHADGSSFIRSLGKRQHPRKGPVADNHPGRQDKTRSLKANYKTR